ncbi:MAG TPA: hypothetical protein VK659_25780 [Asanoa sp.]|nr:hypothetical protein [Asanoa sp.]
MSTTPVGFIEGGRLGFDALVGEREEFIDGLCALGEVADVQRGIERYRAAGATNPVVTGVLGTDYAATLRAAVAAPAGWTGHQQ